MKRYDLHLHSWYSPDSMNSPKDIVKQIKKVGFDGFALTDHSTMKGVRECSELAKKENLDFIPAGEFLCKKGEMIGYFMEEMIKNSSKNAEFADVCDEIHSQGGYVVLPHPFDTYRKGIRPDRLDKEQLKLVDGIETLNARSVGKNANELSFLFATKNEMLTTAGSDAHFIFELTRAYVQITDNLTIEEAFKRKLCSPKGKYSSVYVHGPTTIVKYAKRFGILKPDIN